MFSLNVSFGKKIPVTQCKIFDEKQNRFVPVTVSELDCSDEEDIDILEFTEEPLAFKKRIINDMRHKLESKVDPYSDENNYKFYILGNEEDELLGVCETYDFGSTSQVEYLTRRFDKEYKYIGQTLLASVAQEQLRRQKKNFTVKNPTKESFYTQQCGFKRDAGCDISLNREGMKTLIKKVEERSKSPLINLQA